MKKETVIKTLTLILVPGSIPVYLGYTLYQLYKRNKDERAERENNSEHKKRSEELD